jgi:hypothetical protein
VRDLFEKAATANTDVNYILMMKGIVNNLIILKNNFPAGAPEIIIKRCDKYSGAHGVDKQIDADYRDAFECAYAHFGEQVKFRNQRSMDKFPRFFRMQKKIISGSSFDRIRDETLLLTEQYQHVLSGQLSSGSVDISGHMRHHGSTSGRR